MFVCVSVFMPRHFVRMTDKPIVYESIGSMWAALSIRTDCGARGKWHNRNQHLYITLSVSRSSSLPLTKLFYAFVSQCNTQYLMTSQADKVYCLSA